MSVHEIPALITPHLSRKRGAVWLQPELVAGISYQEWLRG
jgi:hypothetical protein